jgi:hypothetical protein
MSNWREPEGAVTSAQLNHMLAQCQLPPPEELPPERAALRRMHLAELRHAALQDDPIYARLSQEVEQRIAEPAAQSLPLVLLRHAMVSAMQKTLWSPEKGQWFPETWDDVRARGMTGAEQFEQTLTMNSKVPPPTASMLASCYGSIWQRLAHDAYRHAARPKAHASSVGPAITAKELNAMLNITAYDYLPMVGERLNTILAPLSDPDARQFVKQKLAFFMGDYMEGILMDAERKGAYPETWKEFDARARGGEQNLVSFICERADAMRISFQGCEEEITEIYRDVVRLHKTAAQQMAPEPQRYLH